jgi:hypothetical protein
MSFPQLQRLCIPCRGGVHFIEIFFFDTVVCFIQNRRCRAGYKRFTPAGCAEFKIGWLLLP